MTSNVSRSASLAAVPAALASLALLTLTLAFPLPSAHADATPQPVTLYLYPASSPTLQGAAEKEVTVPPSPQVGDHISSIKNVHTPSIEVHLPPPDLANGAAIVIAPGGGQQQLVWGTEGEDIASWLNNLGVVAVILKYRLAGTPGYHYTVDGQGFPDTVRAMRMVRAHAAEWHVAPSRVGIIGFSAGGELAALDELQFDRGDPKAIDPVERQSCRPDFTGLIYPGWGRRAIVVPKDAAPTFLACAGLDDASHARSSDVLFNALFNAGIPVEMHIYAHGGHGGGVHGRNGIPFGTWHLRFQEWLADMGMLHPTASKTPQ
jgi:endo-1,4-beta-xylanase